MLSLDAKCRMARQKKKNSKFNLKVFIVVIKTKKVQARCFSTSAVIVDAKQI
jgi:ribosomal protein L39E